MSLNDKYIINGSTLSAIGSALKTKDIIPDIITINPLQLVKYIKPPTGNDYSAQTFTRTIDLSFFSFLPAGTQVKIYFARTNGNPVSALWNSWVQKIQMNTGEQYTPYKGEDTTQPGASLTTAIEADFPITLIMTGRTNPETESSWLAMHILPVHSDGRYYSIQDFNIPNSFLTIQWSEDNKEGSFVVQSNVSVSQSNIVSIGDLSSKILQFSNSILLAPFRIASYDIYNQTYQNGGSTVLPDFIQSMTDIKKIIFCFDISSGTGTAAELEPATAQVTEYENLGGELGPGVAYEIKTRSYLGTIHQDWESRINSKFADIYFDATTKKLVLIGKGTSTKMETKILPAILYY